ncbi:MAG: hypothetical protein WCP01_03100 [Methylococcaceae bacterium]
MEQQNAEKIKLLLDIYSQDSKQVMVFVSICFALPAFTLSQVKLEGLPTSSRAVLLISFFLFIVAGLIFFCYTQYQNRKRLEGIQSILALNPDGLREILMGPRQGLWAIAWPLYRSATLILILAASAYAMFFILYFFPGIVS